MKRTAESIEEAREARNGSKAQNSKKTAKKELPEACKPFKWKPGQSGNPGGRPKNDIAAQIARAVFENNIQGLYDAFAKALLKGNAYVFKELADRGYGKVKETIQHQGLDGLAEKLNRIRKQKHGDSGN